MSSVSLGASGGKSKGKGPGSPSEQLEGVTSGAAALQVRYEVAKEQAAGLANGAVARASRRFQDGVFAYLTGAYSSASLLFYAVIDSKALVGRPEQPEAEWYLGECLYQDRNYYSARNAFATVVDQGASHPFYEDSLLKLIEIHGLIGDVPGFMKLYQTHAARVGGPETPAALRVRYAMGKALYFQGDYSGALKQFAGFPRGSAKTLLARYWHGTLIARDAYALVNKGDGTLAATRFREALPLYEEALALPASTEEHREVQDLASLAVGRIHFHLGEYPEAIAAYSRVEKDSKAYADALYEVTHCWARQSRSDQVVLTAKAFLDAFPGHVRDPELRMLMASQEAQGGNFASASSSYQRVAQDYVGVKARLDQVVSAHADPMDLFNQLVDQAIRSEQGRELGPPVEGQMPAYAASLARQDKRVDRAVVVSADLREQALDILSGQDLLARIDEALASGRSVGILPDYRSLRRELDSVVAVSIQSEYRLAQVEADYLMAFLGDASALAPLRAALAEQTARNDSVDKEIGQRRDGWQRLARDADAKAVAAETEATDLLARAAALDWKARASNQVDGEAARLCEELNSLLSSLEEERARLSPGRFGVRIDGVLTDQMRAAEDLLRRRTAEIQSQLSGYRERVVDPGKTEFFARLDAARARLGGLRSGAQGALEDLARREQEDIRLVKRVVGEERDRLIGQKTEAERIDAATRTAAGRVAASSFAQVQQAVSSLVMKADAGSADVYWFQIKQIAEKRATLQKERAARQKALQGAQPDSQQGGDGQ